MSMLNVVEIIAKKRDGLTLSKEEIDFFVKGAADGTIADYQIAAWCMAVYLQDMNREETIELTRAMAESGEVLDFTGLLDCVVDKHSSGGIGDKTSLVVLPMVVACGVPVAKMSGRGLSITGGTLDKMESISGYNIHLTREEFMAQVQEHGIVLAGATAELAPADGRLYAIRDVTGTVPSKPLIASSIMSKKVAGGADGIVLDVKVGRGAFMKNLDDAKDLARIMVEIGKGMDKHVTALVSDMNQPLGYAAGNALEVREAIETLRGEGPHDLREHCITVAGHMLRLADKCSDAQLGDIRPQLEGVLEDGTALEVFRTLVAAQGGDVSQVDNPDLLPTAPIIREVASPQSGYLRTIDAREIGLAVLALGAGRMKKGDPIDHSTGIVVHHKVGEKVETGEPLFTVHARNESEADAAVSQVLAAHEWSEMPGLPLFYDTIIG